MAKAIKSRWILILWVIAFVIIKIPVLHYPFFWDESWSYAPGVKLMYQHGPSLMPNAIDLYYSRGHPMLFYAAAAVWMHIFGPSLVSQHCFGLFISVLLLISVYEVCLRLFNKNVALLGLLLVSGQVIFFVQSTMLLPEVMIALLSLLTLYYYATQKYWQTFLACTALVFTKESGMTLGLVLGAHACIYCFSKTATPTQKLKNFLPVMGAGICIGAFFLLQKKLNGWYLFPEHTGLIDMSWGMFKGKLRFCAEIIFYQQFRGWVFLFLMLLSALAAIKTKNFRYALPAIIGLLVYMYIGEHMGYITRRLFIPFIFSVLVYTVYTFNKLNSDTKSDANRFLYLTLFYLGAYLSFSSLNFFTNRYLFCTIVLFLILAAWALEIVTSQLKNTYVFLLCDCAVIIACAFKFSTAVNDTSMGMYPAMEVQQDIVNYFETNKLYTKEISAYSQLQRVHLTRPFTGFRHTTDSFIHVVPNPTPTTDYIIQDNIEADSLKHDNAVPAGFKEVYTTKKGDAWGIIYGKQ